MSPEQEAEIARLIEQRANIQLSTNKPTVLPVKAVTEDELINQMINGLQTAIDSKSVTRNYT